MGKNVKTKNKYLTTLISTIIIFALIPAITTPVTASVEDNTHSNQLIYEVSAVFNKPSNRDSLPLPEQDEEGKLYLSTDGTDYKAYISIYAWYYSTTGEDYTRMIDIFGDGDGRDTFEEGLHYRVYITFECETGYEFPEDSEDITIKINDTKVLAYIQPHETFGTYYFTVGEPDDDPPEVPKIDTVTPSASVEQLKGNQNTLTITVTEHFSDDSTKIIKETFTINNNAAGTYTVGNYKVFVDTKGNTQIRSIYIIK